MDTREHCPPGPLVMSFYYNGHQGALSTWPLSDVILLQRTQGSTVHLASYGCHFITMDMREHCPPGPLVMSFYYNGHEEALSTWPLSDVILLQRTPVPHPGSDFYQSKPNRPPRGRHAARSSHRAVAHGRHIGRYFYLIILLLLIILLSLKSNFIIL